MKQFYSEASMIGADGKLVHDANDQMVRAIFSKNYLSHY